MRLTERPLLGRPEDLAAEQRELHRLRAQDRLIRSLLAEHLFAPEIANDAVRAVLGLPKVADDTDDDHGPWHYTEYGVACHCGYSVDKDERCTRPRGPDAEFNQLVGNLFDTVDSLLCEIDRKEVPVSSVDDLRAAHEALAGWGQRNEEAAS